MKKREKIVNVPTNIITGFLGTGKTTAILHLLQSKPAKEKWAVLVNEFGEIGVDGSMFAGKYAEKQGVFIKEVPGGCMCCTAGLPMQIALNTLLLRSKPDRLLIEPTGLGHPLEVLHVLSGEHYREVLTLHKIITLVDARNLSDSRYTEHETFNQQIAIADIIVGNKSDLYQGADESVLKSYATKKGKQHAKVVITEKGLLQPSWLEGTTQTSIAKKHYHHHDEEQAPSFNDMPYAESGYVKAENEGEGFRSVGWRITPHRVFDRSKLFSFFKGLRVERLKGVFITHDGIYAYNLTSDAHLTEMSLDECMESRVEIIAKDLASTWEKQLMECVTKQ
ncbi:MAG: GTP-binding protein [Spirochaetota bacterium]